MTACTPKEEDEWRSRLEIISIMTAEEQSGVPELHSSLFLRLKSLGTVFGKQGEYSLRGSRPKVESRS